jgi:hypothetical protein
MFYFNVVNGLKVNDPRGLELRNVKAARRYAQELAEGFSLVAQSAGGQEAFVEVVDERGTTVARVKVPSGRSRGNEPSDDFGQPESGDGHRDDTRPL